MTTNTTDATVRNYDTGDTLEGAASDVLVLASLRAHPTGAVCAVLRDGIWYPVEESQASTLRACGEVTHTVYTEGCSAYDAAAIPSVTVRAASASDTNDEGPAYWVSARVDILGDVRNVKVFAAPNVDGRPGLTAGGDSLDCWCDYDLRSAYGEDAAREIGQKMIAMAGTP